MPVPLTNIREGLAALFQEQEPLAPARVLQWLERTPDLPAASLADTIHQAEDLILADDQAHAGAQRNPPTASVTRWTQAAELLSQARLEILRFMPQLPALEDPGDPDFLADQWQSVLATLTLFESAARIQAAYWQGVADAYQDFADVYAEFATARRRPPKP